MAAHLIPHYFFLAFLSLPGCPFLLFGRGREGGKGQIPKNRTTGKGEDTFFPLAQNSRFFLCLAVWRKWWRGPCKGRGWRWTHIQVPSSSSSFNVLFFLCLLLFSWVGEEGSFCIEKTKNPFVASVPMLRRQLCSRYMKS